MSVSDYITNPRGHRWKLDEQGNVDDFAYEMPRDEDGPGHNGPQCADCGYYFCEHCYERGDFELEPCSKIIEGELDVKRLSASGGV